MAEIVKNRRVKMATIADFVGVSRSTVSYVLNNRAKEKQVGAETARAVLEASKKLGYVPNRWAQRLSQHRTGIISILLNSLSYDWSERVVRGAMEILDVEGYLTFLSLHLREAGKEKKDLLSAIERGDEGVLCCPLPGADQVYNMLVERGIPLVFLDDTLTEMPDASYVSWEVGTASQVAMEYLIKNGHKKIGLIGAIFNSWSTKTRCETYKKVLTQAGLPVNEAWIGLAKAGSSPDTIIEQMFAHGQDTPDALFAIDDALAIQTLDKLVRMGIKVPDDVAIVGMGDLQGASHACIGLTTVCEPVEEIGSTAAQIILQLIKNPKQEPIQKLVSGTKLQIRRTA